MTFQERLAADQALVEKSLATVFHATPPRANLVEAMNYSLLAGGKRLRPVLTLETCRLAGGTDSAALSFACAVEMIHTYSLIHDDLPCMDNDDLRRGKPTSHKVFGEATAVLAGDGLLTAAFDTALGALAYLPATQVVKAVAALSQAAGPMGMVGGQILDMEGETKTLTRPQVEQLQSLKTGALIRVAAHLGCLAANADETLTGAVDTYAQKLGLAFQVRDDILDVTGNVETLGKATHSDEKSDKTTFVTLLGLEECQRWVAELSREAQEALKPWPEADFLVTLAGTLAQRTH